MKRSILYRLCMMRHIFVSLRFCLHYFGLRGAMTLPVVFYAPCRFRSLKGSVELRGTMKRGMVAFGLPGNDMFPRFTPCIWNNEGGTVVLHPDVGLNPGASVTVRSGALLEIGRGVSIGQNATILCAGHIHIDSHTLISWDVTIMDTDSHYFYRLPERAVTDFSAPVRLERHSFVASGACILKGAVLPAWSALASHAVLTRGYTASHTLYGGVPARPMKEGLCYISDTKDRDKEIHDIYSAWQIRTQNLK